MAIAAAMGVPALNSETHAAEATTELSAEIRTELEKFHEELLSLIANLQSIQEAAWDKLKTSKPSHRDQVDLSKINQVLKVFAQLGLIEQRKGFPFLSQYDPSMEAEIKKSYETYLRIMQGTANVYNPAATAFGELHNIAQWAYSSTANNTFVLGGIDNKLNELSGKLLSKQAAHTK